MNKSQLSRCTQYRVRLRPIARRFRGDRELRALDDDWLVAAVGAGVKGVEIRNSRTGHFIKLQYDQIHHFAEDVSRDWNGLLHGFLELRCQLRLSGSRVDIEPLPSYCPNCGATLSRRKRNASDSAKVGARSSNKHREQNE